MTAQWWCEVCGENRLADGGGCTNGRCRKCHNEFCSHGEEHGRGVIATPFQAAPPAHNLRDEVTEIADEDICQHCGHPGSKDDPVEDHVVSPPVDGYRVEEGRFHKRCAGYVAEMKVR